MSDFRYLGRFLNPSYVIFLTFITKLSVFWRFFGVSKKPTRVICTVDYDADVCLSVRLPEKPYFTLFVASKIHFWAQNTKKLGFWWKFFSIWTKTTWGSFFDILWTFKNHEIFGKIAFLGIFGLRNWILTPQIAQNKAFPVIWRLIRHQNRNLRCK